MNFRNCLHRSSVNVEACADPELEFVATMGLRWKRAGGMSHRRRARSSARVHRMLPQLGFDQVAARDPYAIAREPEFCEMNIKPPVER